MTGTHSSGDLGTESGWASTSRRCADGVIPEAASAVLPEEDEEDQMTRTKVTSVRNHRSLWIYEQARHQQRSPGHDVTVQPDNSTCCHDRTACCHDRAQIRRSRILI